MRRVLLACALAAATVAHADPERALFITITWDGEKPVVESVDKRETEVPLQRGFPQLWSRFFELRDRPGDAGSVVYAGALAAPRAVKGAPDDAKSVPTFHVVVPDVPDARHLVIYRRDRERGPVVVLEKDL